MPVSLSNKMSMMTELCRVKNLHREVSNKTNSNKHTCFSLLVEVNKLN